MRGVYSGRMRRPHASDDVRERALAAVEDGHRMGDVAAMFRVDPSTLRRWRRRQHLTGSCHTLPRSGRPRRIGVTHEAALRSQVASHPDATLAEHCQFWQADRRIMVWLSVCRRWAAPCVG